MTRRDETCDTRVERLEPRRLFTAGDLIDSDSLVGRSDVVAQELILTTNDQLLAFARSALTHNVTVARVSRDGTLDETFGDGGWIEIDVRRGAIEGNSTVFSNPDTGGFGLAFNNLTNGGVLMFDADGTRDTSFDGDGRWDAEINVHPDFRVRHAQLQSDGKVVIAGTERVTVHHRRAVVRRLNADGSPDASFGGADGAVDLGFAENVADLVVDDDDRITVVAHVFLDSNIATDAQRLVRLMPDGRHDASFGGGDGTVDTPAGGTVDTEVVVGGDGSTYVNRRGVVRRYDESGRLVWTRSDVALTGRMVIDGNDKLLFVRSEGVLPNGSQSVVTRLFPDRETDRAYRWSGTTPLTAVPEAAAAVAQGDELVVLGNTIFSGGTPVLARLEAGPGLRAYVSNQGTLVVRADEAIDLNDVIEIDRRGGDDRIVVRSAGGVAGIDWVGSFAPSRVKRIDVRTFGGDDSVIIGPNVKGAHVDAGAGDDSVTGGDGGDLLFGGDGTDNLLAGAGDDRLFGDGGIDFLFGEDGTDTSDNDPLDTRNDIEQLL